MESKLFSPVTFGPLTLRNRTIRSAAFESMCPENTPTQMLLDYHRSVAAGGVGMTTVAYAAVTQSGLSFDRQLWLRPSIIPRLHELTKAVHDEGAAVGIQIGHCGNMSHKNICGVTPISASSGFNLYSPTFVRGMEKEELPEMAKAYGNAVNLARKAGFDVLITMNVGGHPYFSADGLNILLELPITMKEAVLGAKVTIPTISGKVAVNVPPYSTSGEKLRLKGKGIKSKSGQGDEIVTLKIVAPKIKNAELEKALAGLPDENVRTF